MKKRFFGGIVSIVTISIIFLIYVSNLKQDEVLFKKPLLLHQSKKIIFLGNKNIAPIIYFENNEPQGVLIDITKELAVKMGVDIDIEVTDWADAQNRVLLGEADALLQINPTAERELLYDFSDNLLESNFSIFTRNDRTGIELMNDLKGRKVGVESGGCPIQILRRDAEINVVIIPDWKTGFEMINSGMIDAVVVDRWVGEYVLAESEISGIKVVEKPIESTYSRIAVKKGNLQLLNSVNNSIKALNSDGTMARILSNWSGKNVVYFTKESIKRIIIESVILFLVIILLIAILIIFKIRKLSMKLELDVKARTQELYESGERFRWIFENSPAMIFIVSMASGEYLEVNPKLLKVIGYDRLEIVGHTYRELDLLVNIEDEKKLCDELREKGEYSIGAYKLRTKSGRIVTVKVAAALAQFGGEQCRIIIAQDITKEKGLENDLLRLDRLNLVGEMAASIGHEVRNPMTTVRGYLQMFQGKKDTYKYQEQIKLMIEELDRANFIITEFLSLAKNKTVELKPNNLNLVITAILPLLKADAFRSGHNIEIQLGDVPNLKMDDKEMRQLLLNLAKNGFEAMESGGTLTIASYEENDTIVLAVHDTGKGVSPAIMDQLGTPFITTKENGTGLGIPICYRIAERHGAKIEINSGNEGTVFVVRF